MTSRNRLLIKLASRAVRSRTFRDSDAFMAEFTDTLIELGGVYVKFLQGIILGDAIQKGISNDQQHKLKVYEDNPDPKLSAHEIYAILGPASSRVKLIQSTPIGVGSYSAVYLAKLDEIHDVVVKILRPGVKDEIQTDLKFLRKLSSILKYASPANIPIDLTQMFGSFKKACLAETDFLKEVTFASEMHKRYEGHPHIVIAKTYKELCNNSVIVQDYVGGVSVKDIVSAYLQGQDTQQYVLHKTGTDMRQMLRVLSYDMLHSFMYSKPFHGDLHPGNIRIQPGEKIALIDFGIKAEPYRDSLIPAVINKLRSDTLFSKGDMDLVRIFDAHFQLFMSTIYASIESLFYIKKQSMVDFFQVIISYLGISSDTQDEDVKRRWLKKGPILMVDELLGGVRHAGLSVNIVDQTTQRAITTYNSLLKSVGMGSDTKYWISHSVYPKVCDDIQASRPELFVKKKLLMPDLALENIYLWLEKLSHNNPELAYKIRLYMKTLNSPKPNDTDEQTVVQVS